MPSKKHTTGDTLSAAELKREIESKRTQAAKLRIAIEEGSEKNHAAYRALRREIARLSTAHTTTSRTAA